MLPTGCCWLAPLAVRLPSGNLSRFALAFGACLSLAIVPSTKKVGGPGATLDVPLTHINASYVRSHFDAMEVRVPGAPRPDEMVLILAMSTGARVHARVGGLAAEAIAQWDGQR